MKPTSALPLHTASRTSRRSSHSRSRFAGRVRAALGLLACLCLSGAVLGADTASAQTPTLVWEAKGLARPESVLYDPATDVLYVSNLNSAVMVKDGNGFISRIKPDGTILERKWAAGLDSPTGMGLHDRTLYVADVDRLLALSAGSGSIDKTYKAAGAIFLNDLVVAEDGTVYVSDTPMNTIWRLKDGVFEPWLTDDVLNGPNGLVIQDGKLVVASLGRLKSAGQEPETAGLFAIDVEDKAITPLSKPVGHLDGLATLKPGSYLASDWGNGALYKIDVKGKGNAKVDTLLDLNQGSADLIYMADKQLVLIPMMLDNTLAAYSLGTAKP